MSHWLTQAKKVFKSPEPKPSEKYRLQCNCGETVAGERGERERRAACSTCGFEMFILPASVYPPPRARPPKPPASETVPIPAADQSPDDDEQMVKEEAAPSADQSKAAKPTKKHKEPSKQAANDNQARGIRIRRFHRRNIFTRFRMIVSGILVVLAMTAFVVIRERNMTQAQSVLAESAKAGRRALEEGDLAAAMNHFTAVDRALTIIDSDDRESRELRQLVREVRAANHLLPDTVDEMIAVAAGSFSLSAWQETFRRQYQGKWIVLETTLVRGAEAGEWRIDFPVTSDGEEAVLLIKSDSLARLKIDDASRQVIFAGQLQSCEPHDSGPRLWEIGLDPASTFLWQNRSTYELMGFLPDETVVATLEEQSQSMRGEP